MSVEVRLRPNRDGCLTIALGRVVGVGGALRECAAASKMPVNDDGDGGGQGKGCTSKGLAAGEWNRAGHPSLISSLQTTRRMSDGGTV